MARVNLHEEKDNLLGETKSFVASDSNIKLIREMLEQIDIVEILEGEYDLFFQETSNGWYNTNCPLPGHEDSSPSFGVNRDTGSFHCFGCGASGDLLTFVRKMEGLSFKQAVERVMLITGLNIAEEGGQVYKTLRDINWTADEFLNYTIEYNLPGGISPVQFLRSVSDRLKNFESKVEHDEVELDWVDTVYQRADNAVMKEDYKSLNKLWKNLSNEMKERLYAYRDKINE